MYYVILFKIMYVIALFLCFKALSVLYLCFKESFRILSLNAYVIVHGVTFYPKES
jgi:hypothetical protein